MTKFRSLIEFEVLHEIGEDLHDWELLDIVRETIDGRMSGDVKVFTTKEVTDEEMRNLLLNQRSDPDFFTEDEEETEDNDTTV